MNKGDAGKSSIFVEQYKSAAQKVLDDVPVRPTAAYSLPNPLGYLTSKCKTNSTKYEDREVLCSKRIFEWQDYLDIRIRKELNAIINQLRLNMKQQPQKLEKISCFTAIKEG